MLNKFYNKQTMLRKQGIELMKMIVPLLVSQTMVGDQIERRLDKMLELLL